MDVLMCLTGEHICGQLICLSPVIRCCRHEQDDWLHWPVVMSGSLESADTIEPVLHGHCLHWPVVISRLRRRGWFLYTLYFTTTAFGRSLPVWLMTGGVTDYSELYFRRPLFWTATCPLRPKDFVADLIVNLIYCDTKRTLISEKSLVVEVYLTRQ